MKRKMFLWAFILMAVAGITACKNSGNADTGSGLDGVDGVTSDDIGRIVKSSDTSAFVFTPQWTPQAQFAGYYVAQELGFYRDAGLNVTIEHPSVTHSAMDRIKSNESQGTTLQLLQAMEIIDNNIPLVNILQTSMNNALAIVSREGVDLRTQRGERVGIWAAGFDQLPICMNIKEDYGFEWVRIASNVNLFLSGDLDAIVVMTYNELYQLMQAGVEITEENILRFSEGEYNIQEDGVYVTRDYYLKHPILASAFAAASKRGWMWAAQHQEETLDIVMKYVEKENVPTNRTMQRLMLKEIIRLQHDQQTGKQEFKLKKEMVEQANQLMYEYGLLANEISYEELIP
ncbi:MAG: ABC transporter substrate-binding protein [Bacteroidales bacterium]